MVETDQGLVTLEGHKRLEASRRAGLDEVPVRITEMGEWEYTLHWIDDLIPMPDVTINHSSGHRGWYRDDQVRRALELLREDWSDDRLADLPQLEEYYTNDREPDLAPEDDGDKERAIVGEPQPMEVDGDA